MLFRSAIQTVKYTLQSREKLAIEMSKREDVQYGEVDRTLCKNIMSAGTTDKLLRQQSLLEKRQLQTTSPGSALERKKQTIEEERRARLKHATKQRKQALQTLVQAKKKK